MNVLGIETSCDETAAAVVTDRREILANEIWSQVEEHRPFGGVVPEVAARSHVIGVDAVIDRAMNKAGIGFSDLDAVAATGGPGLIGGVLVGVMTAKAIASVLKAPFIGVNHLEAHALTVRLTESETEGKAAFPYLLLLVSGGHCQLLIVEGVGRYQRLGTTIDDALGEAFDKTAKMLGLGYSGGPRVEAAARRGDPSRFKLPRPLLGRDNCDFSFSGLKTKVRQTIEDLPEGPLRDEDVSDICASFQMAATDVLVDRCARAIDIFQSRFETTGAMVVAGGVAANMQIRDSIIELARSTDMRFLAPPAALCTDNGAMVAWAGLERLKAGYTDGADFRPRPRWPLDPQAA